MKQTLHYTAWWLALAVLFSPCISAETVYQCIVDGKRNFTSNPQAAKGVCQPMQLNVPEPNPVDVERGKERLREYDKEKKADAYRSRNTKEPDADAQRRAQNTELAKSIARAPVPSLGSSRNRSRRRSGG